MHTNKSLACSYGGGRVFFSARSGSEGRHNLGQNNNPQLVIPCSYQPRMASFMASETTSECIDGRVYELCEGCEQLKV
jgi:hypothetical protein